VSEAWQGFIEMRRAMKRIPFTERAQKITLNECERLHMDGYDVAACLDQSVQRGWRGVFPCGTPTLRDKNGTYKVTAEGTRQYIF
jgi:hypothetical protein